MSGLEIFAAATGLYALGSLIDVGVKVDTFVKKGGLEEITEPVTGAELYTAKQEFRAPIYVNMGNSGIGIPVGGRLDTEYIRAHSKFINGKGNTWTNYWAPDHEGRVRWINTVEQLSNVASQYKIDTGSFPVSLPIKLHEHKWEGPVWCDRRAARIGTNKRLVARAAAMARRMPLSITAGVACAGSAIALALRH